MEQDCVFCAIANKQIPSMVIYEDEKFMAFLDIRPLNKGHTLIVPKKHHRWTYEVPEFGEYFEVAKKIALAAIQSLDAKFVHFITAGLGVPHAHIHVIPRFDNDGHGEYLDPTNVKQFTETEFKETAEKIKSAIVAGQLNIVVSQTKTGEKGKSVIICSSCKQPKRTQPKRYLKIRDTIGLENYLCKECKKAKKVKGLNDEAIFALRRDIEQT